MATTAQEKKDLATLQENTRIVKDSCFAYLAMVKSATRFELDALGYAGKTNGETMILVFESYQKQLRTLTDAHRRKYPD